MNSITTYQINFVKDQKCEITINENLKLKFDCLNTKKKLQNNYKELISLCLTKLLVHLYNQRKNKIVIL